MPSVGMSNVRLKNWTGTYDKNVHRGTESLVEEERLFEIVWLFHFGTECKDSHVSSVGKDNVGQGYIKLANHHSSLPGVGEVRSKVLTHLR